MADPKQIIDAEVVQPEIQAIEQAQPYHLGRIGQQDPKKVVAEATEMANALAEVITAQKLFTVIKNRKYVHFEGWATLGGMLGIVPIEEHVREIPNGYEAKVKLIRVRDGQQVGGASSICTTGESLWADRDDYAVRSMAITRATSKAYRMSYSWIIKLAGYEATPIEEAGQIAAVEALAAYQIREAEQMPSAAAIQSGTAAEIIRDKVPGDEILEIAEWKPGLFALSGKGFMTVNAVLSPQDREAHLLRYVDRDKVWVVPVGQAFKFADFCHTKYKVEVKFNMPSQEEAT